ncbi:MAG: TonB-dependent receptor [Cyclobacteriaceae bacterium]
MKLRTTFSILIATFFFFTKGQTISIKDETTNKPISDVFIYHENKSNLAYSDENGVADISEFPSGLIFLQHPSYYEKSLAYVGSKIQIALTEKIVSFSEVVISANKWEQEEESVSQKILSVNRKTIEFQNPQTAADMLSGTGQVFVQKSQLGGGSPKLRGFAANSVLLVVDGVRMNNAIFRSGNLQNVINIDPNALASSEVIFGPGSVIYGSDALGGVMDFHTVDPKWSSNQNQIVTGNLMTRYSSAANEKTGHFDLSLSKQKFTFFHSTTYTSFDDLRSGGNRTGGYEGEFERKFFVRRINGTDQLISNDDVNVQKFSGYDLLNTISKAKVRLGENMDLGYGFYFSTTTDIPRYDNLTETIGDTDSLEAAEWYYGPQKWQMHNLKLNYYASHRLFDQAKVTVAYQKFEESRNDRGFGDDRLRTRTENVDMYSLAFDFDKEFTRSSIYYGVDFFYNDVRSGAFRRNLETDEITSTASRYPNGGSDYSSTAVYASLAHNLSDKLVLNAGARLNVIKLSATTTDSTALSNAAATISLDNVSANGSFGLAWNPTEDYKLSYNVSSGFRSPNIDDVGKVFEVGNSITVPNPDLKPEYSISNELSLERKSDKSMVRIVGFYSRLFDAIVDGPFTINGNSQLHGLDIFAKVNASKANIYGGSLILQAEISESFAIEKTITITEGEDITNNEPLRHSTPIFGKFSLIYKKKKLRSAFYVDYNGSKKPSAIPSSEFDRKPYLYTNEGTPSWLTLNLKGSYQINDFLKANVALENILDKHYRPYTSGISAPGRNLLISFRATI